MIDWLPFLIYFLINCYLLLRNWHRYPRVGQRVTITAAFTYLTAILLLCLTPTLFSVSSAHKVLFYFMGVPYNIIPFQGVSTEFLLNIIMTVPWGVFLYLFNSRVRLSTITGYCFLFSFFIESNQFIWDLLIHLGRLADIDDLITNTAGALIGFILMAILNQTYFHDLIQQLRLNCDESLLN